MEEPSSFFSEPELGWMASSTAPFSRSDLGGGGGAFPTSTPVEAMVSVRSGAWSEGRMSKLGVK